MDALSHHEVDAIIVECCAPIFTLAEGMNDDSPVNLRSEAEEAFLAFERKAFEKQLPSALVRDIKYATAAYVDEVVLSSEWPGKIRWMGRPLCVEFFGDSNAGEGFFKRLTELETDFAKNRAVLEHYYTCIQFGFEGIYRLLGYERLQALQARLREQLDDVRGPVNRQLADSAAPESRLVYRLSSRQPYWVMAALSGALLMGMVALYGHFTRESIEQSSANIVQLQTLPTAPETAPPPHRELNQP